MGNTASGLVEGVSEEKWVDSFRGNEVNYYTHNDDTHNTFYGGSSRAHSASVIHPTTIRAGACYRDWILLHSTLLRSIPLTNDERNSLGLSVNGAFMKRASPTGKIESSNNTERISPPAPFQGIFKSRTITQHMYNKFHTDDGRLTVLFRDFGSLGPTFSFRGR